MWSWTTTAGGGDQNQVVVVMKNCGCIFKISAGTSHAILVDTIILAKTPDLHYVDKNKVVWGRACIM